MCDVREKKDFIADKGRQIRGMKKGKDLESDGFVREENVLEIIREGRLQK